jgi:hypothetical protein
VRTIEISPLVSIKQSRTLSVYHSVSQSVSMCDYYINSHFTQRLHAGTNTNTYTLSIDWFGISCMTTNNLCFCLQSSPIQTSQTGGQWYSDTSLFSIPCSLSPSLSLTHTLTHTHIHLKSFFKHNFHMHFHTHFGPTFHRQTDPHMR